MACVSGYVIKEVPYTDTFWDDLRFPSSGFNPAGSTAPPAVNTSTGLLDFSGTADNVIGGVAQMPHAWKEGTNIHPHIHLRFPTSASANTRWQLQYDIANPFADFSENAGTYTPLTAVTVANPQNVKRHVLASLGVIPMTGYTLSACILWKLTRLAASDGADTDTNAVTLIEFDLHYQIDTPGSDNEYVK